MNKKKIIKNIAITLAFRGLDNFLKSKITELRALREIDGLIETTEESTEFRDVLIESGIPKHTASIATLKYMNKQNKKNFDQEEITK